MRKTFLFVLLSTCISFMLVSFDTTESKSETSDDIVISQYYKVVVTRVQVINYGLYPPAMPVSEEYGFYSEEGKETKKQEIFDFYGCNSMGMNHVNGNGWAYHVSFEPALIVGTPIDW